VVLYRRRRAPAAEPIPEATVTPVSIEGLRRILESAAAEKTMPVPAFASKGLPEEGQPAWMVQISPRDWETLWRAVFSNTLASLRAAQGIAPRIALFASLVKDAKLAGKAATVVRFVLADNAPGVLTTEMIREHGAGRSWDLVEGLLRAHGGSVAVAASIDRQYARRLLIELRAAD
jgi:hypothetical protein